MDRILCLVSAMNAGGAETFLMKIYRKLDKTKYQMDFCVNEQEKGIYEEEIEALGGRIYRVPSKSEDMKGFSRGLYNIVKENGYKRVLRVTSNAFGFYDLYIAKRAGADITVARSSNSSDGGSFKSKAVHLIGKLLFKSYVDVKIAPSDKAAIYTFGKKDYKRGRVHILKNGIDFNEYAFSHALREKVRGEFDIEENTLLIGHIGRFSKQKNHLFLLDVFKTLQENHPNTKLILVGEGELENDIITRASELGVQDKIIMPGVRRDVPALLSAMDLLLFPSLYEGMPNVIIEAQAAGLCCLVSDRVTSEVVLTPLVKQLPITSAQVWQAEAEHIINILLEEGKENLNSRGNCSLPEDYDIGKVADKFISYLL